MKLRQHYTIEHTIRTQLSAGKVESESLGVKQSASTQNGNVLSLDVFDTALTRACGAPGALYLWLGRRLVRSGMISCTPEAFARARSRVENQVWERAGGMDSRVSLVDFYREVVRRLWLSEELVEPLATAELQLEEEVLRATPQGIRLIDIANSAGSRVVFATDTYFPGEFVERQLRRHGLWTKNALCMASSDLAVSKAGGKLFDRVLDAVQVVPSAVVHAGDNTHSDWAVPRQKGLRCVLLPAGRLNRYEQALCNRMWETAGTAAAIAGASRLARLHFDAKNPREAALRDVAAGVAGPILIGFVLWLLHRARDLRLPRLYFLARDGQILARMAEILAKRLSLPIEVRYIYVSRRSVNLAATFEADDEELGWVFRDLPSLSPREFFERLDMPMDAISAGLVDVGLQPNDTTLTAEDGPALATLLRRNPARELLLQRAAQQRGLVEAYLRQEGLLDGTPCGLIDLGGVGSQMRALHALISNTGNPPPRLFLMGLDHYVDPVLGPPPQNPDWLKDTDCYLYDHRRKLGIKRARGFGTCVQMFCAADHGTVRSYSRTDNRIVPDLVPEVDHLTLDWGLPVVQETLVRVVEHLTLDSDLVDPRADLRDAACEVIQMFWSKPTREEATTWGAFPFEGAEAAGSAPKPLARAYSWWFVARGTVNRTFPDLGWQHWFEGSVQASPLLLRLTLHTAWKSYKTINTTRHLSAQSALRRIRRLLGRSSS